MAVDLIPSDITGNADPTPYNEAHLLRVVTLNPGDNVSAFARLEYSGNNPAIYRSAQFTFPIELNLVEGSVFPWDNSDNDAPYRIYVANYASDDIDHDEQKGLWGKGHGTFTVKKKEGRVVTLGVDAVLEGYEPLTSGSFRLQGDIIIDFAQWQTPE